jgi:hypothetical protein
LLRNDTRRARCSRASAARPHDKLPPDTPSDCSAPSSSPVAHHRSTIRTCNCITECSSRHGVASVLLTLQAAQHSGETCQTGNTLYHSAWLVAWHDPRSFIIIFKYSLSCDSCAPAARLPHVTQSDICSWRIPRRAIPAARLIVNHCWP